MKGVVMIFVLILAICAGCAHSPEKSGVAADGDKQAALAECRAYADKQCPARYTVTWDGFVEECMREKGY